jgi:hypothetical protein
MSLAVICKGISMIIPPDSDIFLFIRLCATSHCSLLYALRVIGDVPEQSVEKNALYF